MSIKALSQAGKHIKVFEDACLHPTVFSGHKSKLDIVTCSVNVFEYLEYLDLTLICGGQDGDNSLPGLRKLLTSMVPLKTLTLQLWGSYAISDHDQSFATQGRWKNLTKLSLLYLVIRALDLTRFIGAAMPALSNLGLKYVGLLDGMWEGVIEFMKTSMHLSSFYGEILTHLGGEDFTRGIFSGAVEDYVIRGGRHPSLLAHEPASASEKYLEALGT